MMEEGIDVTGIPGPNPMLGCGMILYLHWCYFKLIKKT